MPTRRQVNGRTVARNAHPRLRLAAAPLHQAPYPYPSARHTTDAGHSQDRRSVLQFVRHLWLMVS